MPPIVLPNNRVNAANYALEADIGASLVQLTGFPVGVMGYQGLTDGYRNYAIGDRIIAQNAGGLETNEYVITPSVVDPTDKVAWQVDTSATATVTVSSFATLPTAIGKPDGFLGFTADGGSYRVVSQTWMPYGGTTLLFDFRTQPAGSTGTPLPGLFYRQPATSQTIQTGTNTLELVPAVADTLRYGRTNDSFNIGLLIEGRITNIIPESNNFSSVFLTTNPTITQTTGRPDPVSPVGTAATRLTADLTGFIEATRTGLNPTTGQNISVWLKPTVVGTTIALNSTNEPPGTASISDVRLAAPAAWVRLDLTNFADTGGQCHGYPVFGPAMTGLVAGARDWDAYGFQWIVGRFPQSLIPTTGVGLQRDGCVSGFSPSTWEPWILDGRFRVEFQIRPEGGFSEYADVIDIPYFWHAHTAFSAFFNQTTGVLTLRVPGGATNTCQLPNWLRDDMLTFYIEVGNGVTQVFYMITRNGVEGPAISLPITGAALPTVVGAFSSELFFMTANSFGGNQVYTWLYYTQFYAPGDRPNWVA